MIRYFSPERYLIRQTSVKRGTAKMPIFKYKCTSCGKVYEELQKSAQEKYPCPECGGEGIRHYQGKCYFGLKGSSSSSCEGKSCSTCNGCSR
ncbi:MAG: zinc ribbon domain-containing protein [Bacillota bacterium]|nr:zinc ribbon domain-containing protein [Bacillota bacterium]